MGLTGELRRVMGVMAPASAAGDRDGAAALASAAASGAAENREPSGELQRGRGAAASASAAEARCNLGAVATASPAGSHHQCCAEKSERERATPTRADRGLRINGSEAPKERPRAASARAASAREASALEPAPLLWVADWAQLGRRRSSHQVPQRGRHLVSGASRAKPGRPQKSAFGEDIVLRVLRHTCSRAHAARLRRTDLAQTSIIDAI